LIGWAPGQGSDQEVFTRDELIAQFSLNGMNEASGVFDPVKLEWMNGLYIRKLELSDFIKRAEPFLKAANLELPAELFAAIAPHVQERVKMLTEIAPMVDFLRSTAPTADGRDVPEGGRRPKSQRDLNSFGCSFRVVAGVLSRLDRSSAKGGCGRFGVKAGAGFCRLAHRGYRKNCYPTAV